MKLLTKWIVLSIVLLVAISSRVASAEQSNKFAEFKKLKNKQYHDFKRDYLSRYEAYKKDIIEKWGVAELSSNTEYISYSEDKNIKVIADFENDTVEVSVQSSDKLDKRDIAKFVKETMISTLNVAPSAVLQTNEEFNTSPNNGSEFMRKPVVVNEKVMQDSVLSHLGVESKEALEEVLKDIEEIPAKDIENNTVKRTQKRLSKQIAALEHFVEREEVGDERVTQSLKAIKTLRKQIKTVEERKADISKKNVKSYKVSLKRERFEKARKYFAFVNQYAEKWQLEKEMLLAIMETESHFNPLAKSHIPAFGLMQIVPATAGADVNQKIFSITKKPTAEQLYDGEQNIKYGSAYFNILMTRYLAEITNKESRLYCAIAAYNTGIGNLSRAFNSGKIGRKKAIEKINQLSPEKVYEVITNKTHTETQRYLGKVLKSKEYFSGHVGTI